MLRFFFFQAEDGIRDLTVTGVQTCALPISSTAVLEQAPVAPLPAPTSSAMVIFENVTKIYEPDVVALRDITFGVDKRSEEHTSELQSQSNLVCRLLLEKKKTPPHHRPQH